MHVCLSLVIKTFLHFRKYITLGQHIYSGEYVHRSTYRTYIYAMATSYVNRRQR